MVRPKEREGTDRVVGYPETKGRCSNPTDRLILKLLSFTRGLRDGIKGRPARSGTGRLSRIFREATTTKQHEAAWSMIQTQDTLLESLGHRGRAVFHPQLAVDPDQVGFDGGLADVKLACHLFVVRASGHQLEYFDLAARWLFHLRAL